MEQRMAGKELDIEIAERVMGLSLDMPRERALSMIGAKFVRSTGHVFAVDYGDGKESLPMPPGENLAGHPSDDNWNQRYMRYVAEKGIERGGTRAAKIERLVAQCRLTPEPYSTDITAAWTVAEKLAADGFVFSLYYDRLCYYSVTHIVRLSRINDSASPIPYLTFEAKANGAPLAICLAALAAVTARESTVAK